MDLISQFNNFSLESYEGVVNGLSLLLYIQIIIGLIFAITAFVAAGTANNGFNVVLTAFINLSYDGFCYYVIKYKKTPQLVGNVIGASVMIILQTLMTTIYWGNLSVCEKTDESISGYSCDQKLTYRALCILAAFLFVFQIVFTLLFVRHQGELLKEYSEYSEILSGTGEDDVKNQVYKPQSATAGSASSSSTTPQPSVDL